MQGRDTNSTFTVAMDGNFGLVRKKSSGQSVEPPKHGTRIFLSDDEVTQAVASCDNDSKVGDGVSLHFLHPNK